MAYTQEAARFAEQIAARTAERPASGRSGRASAPIDCRRAQTIENIQTARKLGAAGVILFSYDSLIDPQQSAPGYLATVGRAVFATGASAARRRLA